MDKQEKRKNVINGLESFKADLKPFAGCHADWEKVDDALALLKAQEQEVVNLTTKIVELTTAQEPHLGQCVEDHEEGWREYTGCVKQHPTTQLQFVYTTEVVPVVRCKDCKHRDPEDKKCDCGAMTVNGLFFPRPDNWYCADGERREDHVEVETRQC